MLNENFVMFWQAFVFDISQASKQYTWIKRHLVACLKYVVSGLKCFFFSILHHHGILIVLKRPCREVFGPLKVALDLKSIGQYY